MSADLTEVVVAEDAIVETIVVDADGTEIVLDDPADEEVSLQEYAGLTKEDVGLGNVDNTADLAKPVSVEQTNAINAAIATAQSYADGLVVGLLDDRGSYDASGNTYPASGGSGSAGAIKKGDLWIISVAGTLGGTYVAIGDAVRALADTPGQTAANWAIMEGSGAIAAVASPGGRLTLESGVPVSISDQTAKTNLYYTPAVHNGCTLWNGSEWQAVTFSEITLALGTLSSGKPYDVFGYLSGGALALELLVWTNDSTRATAVTLQDGRWCKSGDKTRLLLGTIYTTSTTTTEDSSSKRYVGNVYNTSPRPLLQADATNSWLGPNFSWRQANASSANQVNFVLPITGAVQAFATGAVAGPSPDSLGNAVGIGVDSTSTSSGINSNSGSGGNWVRISLAAAYNGVLAAGMHYLAWLEYSDNAATNYFFGDDATSGFACGITARVDL